MSEIIFPDECLPEIDWTNPLTEGLKFGFVPSNGIADIVDGQDWQIDLVNDTISSDGDGTYWYGNAGYGLIKRVLAASEQFGGGQVTMLNIGKWVNNSDIANFRKALGFRKGAGDRWTTVGNSSYNGDSDWTLRDEDYFSTFTVTAPNTNQVANGLKVCVGTVDNSGGRAAVAINGELSEDTTVTINTANVDILGSEKTNTNAWAGVNVYAIMFWDRSLSNAELLELSQNPYQLFKTEETKRDEYALTFDDSNYVRFPTFSRTQFVYQCTFIPDGVNDFVLLGEKSTNISQRLFLEAKANLKVKLNVVSNASYQTETAALLIPNEVNVVELDFYPTTDSPFSIKINGVEALSGNSVNVYDVEWSNYEFFTIGAVTSTVSGFITLGEGRVLSAKLTKDNGDNLWIFDRKDNPATITDEYNGAIATLVGSPTFERVLPKLSFDVGTGKDYTKFSNFVSAQGADENTIYEAVIHNDLTENLTLSSWSTKFQAGCIARGAIPFTGDENNAIKVTGTDSLFIGARRSAGVGFSFWIEDLVLKNTHSTVGSAPLIDSKDADKHYYMNRCSYEAVAWNNVDNRYYLGTWDGIKNSVLKTPRVDGDGHTANIVDSIILDNNFATPTASNLANIVYDIGGGSITETTTITHTANANGQGWFVDDANDNYQINNTGQTTLQGQGWNGSDIASAFYTITSELTRVTKDFIMQIDMSERVTKDFIVTIDLLETITKDFTIISDLLTGVSVSKDFQIKVDLAERVLKDYQVNVDLAERVLKDYQVNVDLLQRQIKDFSVNVDLLKRETLDFIINTDFKFRSSKSFIIDVDLLQGVRVTKPFSIVVDFNERITKTFDIETQLLERVTRNHEIVADLLNRVTMDFMARFDLFERVNKDFEVKIDYIERVSKDFNIVVRIDSDIIVTTPAHYVINIDGSVEFTDDAISIQFSEEDTQHFII